jgi:translation initiation factor 2 subunit 1
VEEELSLEDVAFPEVGELVICTVTRISPYGVYVTLDEYEKAEGFLHISEVSSRWVKNIREHVRENQKTVLKVLRIDPAKLHADLSLRRVNDRERKEKLLQWKQENRGKKLLELAAEKMNVTPEEAYEKVGKIIEDSFENIYLGLEKTVEKGESVLTKCGVPPDWASVLAEIAGMKIKAPKIKIEEILS